MLSPHQLEFNLFQHIPIYSNHFESFGPTFCLIHFFSVARNPDMENQDVVLVVGANDVVNSAAQAWVKPSWVISWNMIFGGFFHDVTFLECWLRRHFRCHGQLLVLIVVSCRVGSGAWRLCHLGHASDWSLEIQEGDLLQAIHGWRCRFFFGHRRWSSQWSEHGVEKQEKTQTIRHIYCIIMCYYCDVSLWLKM